MNHSPTPPDRLHMFPIVGVSNLGVRTHDLRVGFRAFFGTFGFTPGARRTTQPAGVSQPPSGLEERGMEKGGREGGRKGVGGDSGGHGAGEGKESGGWQGCGGRRVQANSGERSEGVGGTFGRLTLFNTATHQKLLDPNHSKAHKFKEEREGEAMQSVCVKNALSKTHCQGKNLLHISVSACCLYEQGTASREYCG